MGTVGMGSNAEKRAKARSLRDGGASFRRIAAELVALPGTNRFRQYRHVCHHPLLLAGQTGEKPSGQPVPEPIPKIWGASCGQCRQGPDRDMESAQAQKSGTRTLSPDPSHSR